jgi:DNA-binding NarL/FixJ family response regulator
MGQPMRTPRRLQLGHSDKVVRLTSRFRPRLVYARGDATGASASSEKAPRILVVEDDFLVSAEIEAVLTAAGFEVVAVATSADEAVRLAGAENPRVVVMDVRLDGGRDGVDAAIEIFESLGIRSVFTTAYHDGETRRRAAPATPLGWLAKPYTMESLVVALRAALREIEPRAED